METVQKRQKAIENFIATEIFVNQNALVKEAFETKIFTRDEIYNLIRPFDGKLLSPSICIRCNCDYSFLDSETGQCDNCYEETQKEQVIFEWWLVTSWLGRKLIIEGEPVINNNYGIWWGRTTTGQAIYLDAVINAIYDDAIE